MPYLDGNSRDYIDRGGSPETAGQLTYAISRLVERYMDRRTELGPIRYADMAAVLGALEGTKAEFEHQVVRPYEDRKLLENGLVFKPR
jgi:hypothetical protein